VEKIEISIKEKDNLIVLEFVDSGDGIPDKDLDKVFEALFTTKQKGTGLGLASCRNIVEQHQGEISVKNNPTTFTINTISTHAIGDKAVRNILDVYEELREERGDSMNRHRVTHGFLISPEDRSRFAEIGVGYTPDFEQAAPIGITWGTIEKIGERTQQMFPIGDVVKSGGLLSFGIDWPVGNPDAFVNIEAVVTRTAEEFPERGTLGENQEITVEEAVAAFTINGAWMQGFDEFTGSIEEGKNADFVIVDKNIFEIPANEISNAKVLQTFFQGNNIFDSNLPQQQDDYDKLIEAIKGLTDEEFIMVIQEYGS